MVNIKAEKSTKVYLGEGPHWDEGKQELLYVDIFGNSVHRYVPSTGEHYFVYIEQGPVSLVVPVEGHTDKYLISVGRDTYVMTWNGITTRPSELKKLYTVDEEHSKNRINDGKCDFKGRLWAGTMGYEPAPGKLDQKKGSLFKFDLDGKISKHADRIDISNGLAWSSDNKIMYYIDTFSFRVDAFDYDLAGGLVSNRRSAFDFKANGVDGVPDGMTIDSNGNIWVAIFAGKKIVHIDPNVGKKIGQIDMPTTNMTSVTFGGPNLDILYATSAEHFLSKEDLAKQNSAGSIFAITNTGAKGVAAGFNYKGPI